MLACLNNIQKIRPNERNYFERICGIRYFERIFAAAWVVWTHKDPIRVQVEGTKYLPI